VKRLMVVAVVVLLVVGALPASAQGGEVACTAEEVAAAIQNAQALLTEAQLALDGGKIADALAAFEAIDRAMDDIEAACTGMSWSGDADLDDIYTITLEEGVYIVSYELIGEGGDFSFGGSMSVGFDGLDNGSTLFPFMEMADAGETVSGRETLDVRTTDRYLMDLSVTGSEGWSLTITKP
jgi:type II secretory pathway pseudopilin PulG